MTDSRYDILIIGGGVIGLAVALETTSRFPRRRPAATASLMIGKTIVDTAATNLGLA